MICARCHRSLAGTGTQALLNGLPVIVGPSCARILAGPQLELAPKRKLVRGPRRRRQSDQVDLFGAAA